MSAPVEVGFFGKLPSHGDFLRRRVSDPFVRAWDEWLQACVSASRAALGDRWLEIYLTSPAWRFGCSAGAAGPAPVVGVMAPSVDRVGRYFPLTVAAELPSSSSVLVAATDAETFFDRAERLVIDTLAAEVIDFDEFDAGVGRLGADLAEGVLRGRVVLDASATDILQDGVGGSWNVPIGSPPRLAPAFMQLLSHRLTALYGPLVLWWTEGSASVQPTCLLTKGLPRPEAFASLLDGSFAGQTWRTVPVHVDVGLEPDD